MDGRRVRCREHREEESLMGEQSELCVRINRFKVLGTDALCYMFWCYLTRMMERMVIGT